jgi:hypothetical protein
MFGADLRTPFHHQRGGQPLLTEAPKRRPGPITASRGVKPPVWVMLVAPAVGEPLPEPGARDLATQLGLQAAPGVPCPGRDRALDVAQLRLHVRLQRAGEGGGQFHAQAGSGERVLLVIESGSLPRDCRQPKGS